MKRFIKKKFDVQNFIIRVNIFFPVRLKKHTTEGDYGNVYRTIYENDELLCYDGCRAVFIV